MKEFIRYRGKGPGGMGVIIFLGFLFTGVLFNACEDLLSDLGTGDPRDKLEDTWKCDETPGTYKSAMEVYWVEISKHPYDSTRVIIYNFFNVDADAEAILMGNSLSLPLQTLEGGFKVQGSGQIQGLKANEIIWTYTIDDGSGTKDNYTAVYSRLTL